MIFNTIKRWGVAGAICLLPSTVAIGGDLLTKPIGLAPNKGCGFDRKALEKSCPGNGNFTDTEYNLVCDGEPLDCN